MARDCFLENYVKIKHTIWSASGASNWSGVSHALCASMILWCYMGQLIWCYKEHSKVEKRPEAGSLVLIWLKWLNKCFSHISLLSFPAISALANRPLASFPAQLAMLLVAPYKLPHVATILSYLHTLMIVPNKIIMALLYWAPHLKLMVSKDGVHVLRKVALACSPCQSPLDIGVL